MVFTALLVLVPISLVLAYATQASAPWIFISAALAIVPLAEWIRRATEQLARLSGPGIGGLLNVTFGNATELILALFVLAGGNGDVVKGQITGSIIGNSLLGLGLAILVGTWGRDKLTFQRERASLLGSLLFLAVIALLVPAMFHYTERGAAPRREVARLDEDLSIGVSIVLLFVYLANLAYTLVTHRDAFRYEEAGQRAEWPLWKAIAVLAVATAVIAWEAELLSEALNHTAVALGMTPFFLGIIVLAVVGNAAEYVSAVYFARQQQLTLTFSITIGSTIQVALLLAPLLVIISYFLGWPMNLVFVSPLELLAIVAVALSVNSIAEDGETTWFEGVMLLSVYAILGLAFFFVTP
jgi:Ca2+:H+ antiporter